MAPCPPPAIAFPTAADDCAAMSTLVPYLTFRDADASLAFLTGVLGFEVVTEQRDDGGALVHAELRRGDALVMGGAGEVEPCTAPGLSASVPSR